MASKTYREAAIAQLEQVLARLREPDTIFEYSRIVKMPRDADMNPAEHVTETFIVKVHH